MIHGRATMASTCMLVYALAVPGAACTNTENQDDAGVFRLSKRLRQPMFKPEDFTFAKA